MDTLRLFSIIGLLSILNIGCNGTSDSDTDVVTSDPLEASSAIEITPAFENLPNFPSGVLFAGHAGDGSNRLFVVQQEGIIYVLNNTPSVSDVNVFMDISSKVSSPNNRGGGEEGLLGLAFDPNYVDNGYFYVYYSASEPRRSVVSRYQVSGSPNQANLNSEEVLLSIEQPFSNHNGGWMDFGSDGFLYIALGDGGSGGDPQGNGQDRTTLLGSILRIDPSVIPYQIPDDNPFVGEQNTRAEIWAYGLRNPWRCSFDRLTDDLWCGDVGQNAREEIDRITRGANYGWNIFEGSRRFSNGSSVDLAPPFFEYGHDVGQSITGGYVYRGSLSALNGYYLYGDFVSGRIWALNLDTGTNTEISLEAQIPVASFAEDEMGEIYIIAYSGEIYRFRLN